MNRENTLNLTRRQLFSSASRGLGAIALANLLGRDLGAATMEGQSGLPGLPHFKPKAKHVIYLFQSGGPSQIDLYDNKPGLGKLQGSDLPGSIRKGQRLTGMTAAQATFPVASSKFAFARHGQSGQEFSELLPYTARIADDMAVVRSMFRRRSITIRRPRSCRRAINWRAGRAWDRGWLTAWAATTAIFRHS